VKLAGSIGREFRGADVKQWDRASLVAVRRAIDRRRRELAG
jgi:hypothetical protein